MYINLPPVAQPRTPPARSRITAALSALRDAATADVVESTGQSALVEHRDADDSEDDRRGLPRHGSNCRVAVCRRRNDQPFNPEQSTWSLHSGSAGGSLEDISLDAAAFLHDEPLVKGEEVLLRISNPRIDKRLDVRAEVLRAVSQGGGLWKIVCRLHTKLEFEQLYELGRQLLPSQLV